MQKKIVIITVFIITNSILCLYTYGVVKNLNRGSNIKVIKYDYGYNYDVKS